MLSEYVSRTMLERLMIATECHRRGIWQRSQWHRTGTPSWCPSSSTTAAARCSFKTAAISQTV
jgi:hypothetical protein